MSAVVEELLSNYHDWLKGRVAVVDVGGAVEITTPFLDRHNDRLQIYVVAQGEEFRLTDDGYIIGDLAASGCPLDTAHRKRLLDSMTRGFGVEVDGDELTVTATADDFPRKKHMLVQAMLAVNDMFMTARKHVTSLFIEDVKKYLDAHDVRYSPNIDFTGKSGLRHRFDYVIPKSRKQPERLIRVVNNPGRNDITALLFAWTDTKEVREEKSAAYAVLNDEERELSKDVVKPLAQYGIHVVPWSQREKFAGELAA